MPHKMHAFGGTTQGLATDGHIFVDGYNHLKSCKFVKFPNTNWQTLLYTSAANASAQGSQISMRISCKTASLGGVPQPYMCMRSTCGAALSTATALASLTA
mmetsp:Transcript_28768/g.85090  ORF Transcript_28768/g.85090 Transcript_28768/m.85090 type:complete len:101 (-) Transcript_28768:359-661(-)